MFTWNDDKIRFLADASEYGGFNETLAARIAPYLLPDAHVCDAGCGLGYLSLALAPYCGQVTAVDVSADALAVLQKNVEARGIANVATVCGDAFNLPEDARFDAMAFCFFGGVSEVLRCAAAHCDGTVILIKKNWETHRFTLTETPLERFTFRQSKEELDRLSVPYASESFPLEMGQPFRSRKDAVAFFRLNSRGGAAAVTEEALSARLVETDSAEFPYYLPSNRPVGMLVVRTADIPASALIEVNE